MASGRVKWFNAAKGFGFIERMMNGEPLPVNTSTKNNNQVFVHYTSILGDGFKVLSEGTEVQFDLYETDKGLIAENVKINP